LWKFKKLLGKDLLTVAGEPIVIHDLGTHNHYSGPDFFNARLSIADQQWAGNVEMHVKASDWYLHGHDDDPAYDNVILHVVYHHDAEITRRDGVVIPVLEVDRLVPQHILEGYRELFETKEQQFIQCEKQIHRLDRFNVEMWLESVYLQRLERKQVLINRILKDTENDWEALFFRLLCRSFGTKVNADAFEQTASSISQNVVRKLARDAFNLEAVLMGQSRLLDGEVQVRYGQLLREEYAFAKAKYSLRQIETPMKFFRVRPVNYPTIRFSQLAQLYHRSPHLFAEVLLARSRKDLHDIFVVRAAEFWNSHHVFHKSVAPNEKWLTKSFIDLLIINTVLPIKFAYYKHRGEDRIEDLLDLMREIPFEKNKITKGFEALLPWLSNALHSQAVLELKPNFCDKYQCLRCAVGVKLLQDG
jgi:hypothetical protein